MDLSNVGRPMHPKVYQALIKADIASLKTMLLESPRYMDGITVTRNTALHIAAEADYNWSIPEIHEIFNSHMHFQFATNSRGDTPLHCAARAGKNVMADFLIGSRKTDGRFQSVDIQNECGDTPLHMAARKGHSHIACELIKADALLAEAINKHGESALYLAAESEAVEIVSLLLLFPTCAFAGPNGQTALHAAVCRNHEITRLLLQTRPSLKTQVDTTGSSPLHYAASIGDHKMIQLLLQCDAFTVHILDKDGLSPLHVAAAMGYTDVITELIKHCPDAVELADQAGRNFLHVAIDNKKLKVVKYVLQNPALMKLLNEPDQDGNTPLHFAALRHNLEAVHLLLADKRIDTRSRNHKGLTPLDVASLCVDSSIRLRMVFP